MSGDIQKLLGIELLDTEQICEDTVEEFSNGEGEEDEQQQIG